MAAILCRDATFICEGKSSRVCKFFCSKYLTRAISELAASATTTAIAEGVAMDILYIAITIAVAAILDMA